MRAVIQRVKKAEVTINSKEKRNISQGLLILLGIEDSDNKDDIDWLAKKISGLRIFDDENDVMNLSIKDVKGQAMIISQFTLHAKTKKGNRPSYIKAAKPDVAIPVYEEFISSFEKLINKKVATGEFGAHMDINLINDGPVTIIIDTKNKE